MSKILSQLKEAEKENLEELKLIEKRLMQNFKLTERRISGYVKTAANTIEKDIRDHQIKSSSLIKKTMTGWTVAIPCLALLAIIIVTWYANHKLKQADLAEQTYQVMRSHGVTGLMIPCTDQKVPCVVIEKDVIRNEEFYKYIPDQSFVLVPIAEIQN